MQSFLLAISSQYYENLKLTKFWIFADETVEELAGQHQIQLRFSISVATDLE
jgi:hypothetical protein